MKPSSISLLGLLLILLSTSDIKAQGSQIGLDIGYGLTKISDDFPIILPGDDDLLDFAMIGIAYSYTPKRLSMSFKLGLNYNNRGFNITRLTYIKIPLGVESKLGKKVQFILGGGLFLSYLLTSQGGTEIDYSFDRYKNNLQIGFYGNIGIGFQLSPKYNLCLTYQADTDINNMFEYETQGGGGDYYTVSKIGHDSFVKLSLYYRFSTK